MRILVLTNLYPNPFEPTCARSIGSNSALAERHSVEVISPISWVEELAARRKGAPRLPKDRPWSATISPSPTRGIFILRNC